MHWSKEWVWWNDWYMQSEAACFETPNLISWRHVYNRTALWDVTLDMGKKLKWEKNISSGLFPSSHFSQLEFSFLKMRTNYSSFRWGLKKCWLKRWMGRQNLGTKIKMVYNILCVCLLLFTFLRPVSRVASWSEGSLSPLLRHAIPECPWTLVWLPEEMESRSRTGDRVERQKGRDDLTV